MKGKKKKQQKNEGGKELMKKGRKEILRGEERFLKAPKNDGNGGEGGAVLEPWTKPVLISRRSASQTGGM